MTDSPYKHLIGGARIAVEEPGAPRVAFRRVVGATPSEAHIVLARQQAQRRASSCLPHAAVFVRESDIVQRTGARVEVSIQFDYWGYRHLAGDDGQDVGSYPHHMQTWCDQHGSVPDVLAPYNDATATTWRPGASLAAAAAVWTSRFERMAQDAEQIEGEIASGRGVVVCHHVFDQMAGSGAGQAGKTGLETFNPSWQSLGGHGRAIVSYDRAKARFGVANWWGASWGVRCPWDETWAHSYSEVPYEVVTDSRWAWDFRRLVRGLEVEV